MYEIDASRSLFDFRARPQGRTLTLLQQGGLAFTGTAIIAVAAHVAIPLPFTAVPFTLQPLAVLLVGLLFGPALGFSTLCLYLAEGVFGLPVFQPHGLGGIAQIAGPTGGFLIAYPFVAAIAGALLRLLPLRSRWVSAVIAGFTATSLLFCVGALWFAFALHVGMRAALFGAVLPFLPGEAVKVFAAAGIATAWRNRPTR